MAPKFRRERGHPLSNQAARVDQLEVRQVRVNVDGDAGKGLVGWNAPLARALRGAGIGDLRRVTLPGGEREYEVIAVTYP